MIGLDTNVLVRYLTQDDEMQSAAAGRLIESFEPIAPGFVSLVTLVETMWVLDRSYRLDRERLGSIVDGLLTSKELVLDRAEDVVRALRLYRRGNADFSDCLIFSISERCGCEATMTFDARAARTASMTLLAS